MSATAVQHTAGYPVEARAPAKGWIQSPTFDLALFILAPLAGLAVILANGVPGGYRLGVAATFLVAIPHYMSSFSFYLGDDNLRYYRSRRLAFFVGPIVIFAVVALLRTIGYHGPVQSAMYVWNVYHVSLQSAGILSLYRRLNGGPFSERRMAHVAILAVNATMAFWFIDRFPPLYDMLVWLHPLAALSLRVLTLPVAICALSLLLYRVVRRPRPMSLAEGSFLVSSLLLFHPYLWVPDSAQATFAMLMGHFIQYLAIVWLLNSRKYPRGTGSRRQQVLGWISSRPIPLFGTLAAVGLVFYSADKISGLLGVPMLYITIWNAMTLVHFYVDGMIWAFRQHYVRDSIGPYLTPPARIAT